MFTENEAEVSEFYTDFLVNSTSLLLLLLSHFSHARLCMTPSLGFSKQEHWGGLPFPSPMHKSEKWKWNCSVMFDSSRPHGLQPTRLLCLWDFPGKSTGLGCLPSTSLGYINVKFNWNIKGQSKFVSEAYHRDLSLDEDQMALDLQPRLEKDIV